MIQTKFRTTSRKGKRGFQLKENKANKSARVRFLETDWEKMEKLSNDMEISMSEMIRIAVRDYLIKAAESKEQRESVSE